MKSVWLGLFLALAVLLGISVGWWLHSQASLQPIPLQTGIEPSPDTPPKTPLLAYSIPNLRTQAQTPATITVSPEPSASYSGYLTYPFEARVVNKRMTGVINTPLNPKADTPVIVMLRGWVPPASYEAGVGTKNAAAAFAQAGFITLAPDFFGYGESDPEPEDSWQGRFEKPIITQQFILALQSTGLSLPEVQVQPKSIGMWGHSNGGQIALSTLSIMKEPIPTTLWAPVTAPFPYNILYFSDEEADEGRATRKWIALFDELYDSRAFSFTNYLDGLQGPLQIHQGTNDDAVLQWWSDEFTQKLEGENKRRKTLLQNPGPTATPASQEAEESQNLGPEDSTEPIAFEYFLYPGANHNLTPGWDTVVERDIAFFTEQLQY